MERLFGLQFYLDQLGVAEHWLAQNALALSLATIGQAIVVGGTFLAARKLDPKLRAVLTKIRERKNEAQLARVAKVLEPLTLPVQLMPISQEALKPHWPICCVIVQLPDAQPAIV